EYKITARSAGQSHSACSRNVRDLALTAVPQKSNKPTSHLKSITFLSTCIICRNIDRQYKVQANDLH
ncbi:hypothetical protein Q7I24_16090, partial [Aeromonas veronii]|uniref:hypothetical protein n=1 Tax=Aeromonas veronii TaxID=654 RepID=UPI00300405AD